MGLAESTKEFIGQLLHVDPHYGYGWARVGEGLSVVVEEKFESVRPFNIRLLKLFSFDGELRGGVARVEEPGHKYDNNYVVFSTRHEGTFDFEKSIGHYDISTGSVEPFGDWPLFPRDSPGVIGFAEIRGSKGT
jgi:hypothetical protein